MITDTQKIKVNRGAKIASAFVAAMPIIGQYNFIEISCAWILGAIFFIYVMLCDGKGRIYFNKIQTPYWAHAVVTIIVSLNGFLILRNSTNLVNALIGMAINVFLMMQLWQYADMRTVVKYANRIGIVCCLYVFYQFTMVLTTGDAPNGYFDIPFLSARTGWVNTTWGYRLNSIFSEPSYFSIYLLPLFALNFLERNYKYALLFGVSIILSSSTLGIAIMFISIIWVSILGAESGAKKMKRVGLLLLMIAVVMIVIANVPALNAMVIRTFDKVQNSMSGEDNIRITGYINEYFQFSAKELIFGIGASQFQNYMAEQGVVTYNYSNSFVYTLLQSGVVGLASLLVMLGYACKVSVKNKAIMFWVIFVLVLATDLILFSDRYYYLLYFVVYYQFSDSYKSSKKFIKKNKNVGVM